MFDREFCKVQGCPNKAVSFSEYCFSHIEDRAAYIEEFRAFFESHTKFTGLNIAYVPLDGFNIMDKSFLLADFNHTRFHNLVSQKMVFHMCFFDYCSIESCILAGSRHTNCIFAGSHITDTRIENASMLQNNFNNCVIKNVTFTGSDLYNSRFLFSRLENTVFYDCNLKNVDFRYSIQQNVSYKFSNHEEAIFADKVKT